MIQPADLGTAPAPAPAADVNAEQTIGPNPLGGYRTFVPQSKAAPRFGKVAAAKPGNNVANEIRMRAAQYGVPPTVALAVAHHVSGLNQSRVRGPRIGVFGVPAAAAQSMNRDPFNWRDNIAAGVQALAAEYKRHGNWRAAVKAVGAPVEPVVKTARELAAGHDLGPGFTGNVRVAAPVPGNPDFGAGFGVHGDDGHVHPGVDIIAPNGTPVSALVGGKVLFAGDSNGSQGSGVVIEDKQGRHWAYAHLAPGSHQVQPGQTVKPGDPIGAVGESGHVTGPHVYIQLQVGKTWLNPTTVLQRAFAIGKGTIQISDADFAGQADQSGLPANVNQPSSNLPGPAVPPEVSNIPTPGPPPAPIDKRIGESMTAMAGAGPSSPELQNLQRRQQIFSSPGVTA